MDGVSTNPQGLFTDFCVPDKSRIIKVKNWLEKNGYINLKQDIYLLDIGYAKGSLADNLPEYKNIKKYGIDKYERYTPNDVVFIKHDCNYGLPDFEGLMFDVVFAGEIIEHIFDDRKFLKQIYEILKPAGVLVLTVPNLFFLINRIIFPLGKMPYFAYSSYHYHFYNMKILVKVVTDCGFIIKRIASSHIFISTRRNKFLGKLFEFLGDIFPNLGAHLILFAIKPKEKT